MVSVCIATYNGEHYLREQLDSILAQIGEEDEVVISDDSSTDGTLPLIESYHDPRIRVLHHDPNLVTTTFPLDRPTHNFENALRHAKGDILFLADQDDVWLEGKVETMLAQLQDAHLAIHDCTVVDSHMRRSLYSSSTYLGCCMAMRREVVQRALPFPSTMVGHDLWLGMIADRYFTTKLVRKSLLRYRKHTNSKTTSGGKSKNTLWFKIHYRLTILTQIAKMYI